MDLKYLNTLKAILETGSFQNAAKRLNYTQSTVTFQVQQLEQSLSVQLFEKIGRKMHLTQAGRELFPYVDAVLRSVEELESFARRSGEISGTLRVSMPESLLTYKMQGLLKAFRAQAPGVNLSLQATACALIRDQIINGGTDIAITYDIGGYGNSVVSFPLPDFQMTLVVSPELEDVACDFMTPHQKKQLCLISMDRESVFRQALDRCLKERDISIEQELLLGSVESIKRSVMSNLGFSPLPRFAVEDELRGGLLREVDLGLTVNTVSALCAYHKNKWISPAMELFLSLTKEFLCSEPAAESSSYCRTG